MTASLPSPRLLSRLCTPLNRDINGNPRFFLPAAVIGIEANGDTRRKVGLTKYRGKGYGPGFVIQSYNLEGDMAVIIETKPGSAHHSKSTPVSQQDHHLRGYLHCDSRST